MSTTRNEPSSGSSCEVAPRKERRASSSPVSNSGRVPTISSAAAKKSSRLAASRAAEVAVMRTRVTPRVSITLRNSRRTSSVRSLVFPMTFTPVKKHTYTVTVTANDPNGHTETVKATLKAI